MPDKFKFFVTPMDSALTVEIPSQVTTSREVTRLLHTQCGLSFPSDTETFWVNSRRCILTRKLDGSPLGELLEVLP